jgi:hypothetical protein
MEKSERKVEVEVAYTGHDEYKGAFEPEATIGTIKDKALHHFHIEESAADKYVLEHNGVHLDDKLEIGSFKRHEVKLVLLLKKPQEKGYVG